jgi:hypothetical protein
MEKSSPILNKSTVNTTYKQITPSLFFQPKLTVNQPNDIYEQEADAMADRVMRMPDTESTKQSFFKPVLTSIQRRCKNCDEEQKLQRKEEEPIQLKPEKKSCLQRKCAGCAEEEEKKVQRKEESSDIGGMTAPYTVDNVINSGGEPLDGGTRDFMESRFGYDFRNVQIHNDLRAHESSSDINALAYTHQNHIAFGAGQYQPGTEEGKKLLAHELTHVVQQSGGINKKTIQRKPFFLAPLYKPSGNSVHAAVLPLFAKANSDLFIEVKIPGAKKMDVDKGVTGIADFYKATPTAGTSRTIGINFDGNNPSYLGDANKLEFGGGKYNHKKNAAPLGGLKSPKVTKLAVAPTDIHIGDLKPGFSSETFLGEGQVEDYKSGVKNTSVDINKYIVANPTEADSKTSWTPNPQSLSSLTIPQEVKYPSGRGFPVLPLALYEEGFAKPKMVLDDTSLKGRLFVYKDKVSGVWSYEWLPENIPASTGSRLVNTVLDRLNGSVIPALTAANSGTVAPKRVDNKGITPIQKASTKLVQKTDKKFNDDEWKKTQLAPWQTEAQKFLANKDEVKKAQVSHTLLDIEQRSGINIGIPAEVRERGTGLDKIKHWNRFGGLYGWLREKFDFVYVKLQAFGKKVKEKIAKLTKSSAGVKFAGFIQAAAQVAFKIFKMVGGWVINEVVDKLINSFREGVMNNLKKLVDMYTPEDVKSKIEEFEATKEQYEQIINEQEDALIQKFFGDKLDLFEKLSEFEAIANTLSTIVSLVKWGMRLIACASPPAVGCLLNLLNDALELAFALLIQTCWFSKNVYKPVIDLVGPVKRFPTEVAAKVVDVANSYIPMPKGLSPIFAPIKINTDDYKVDCDEKDDGAAKLTPEREAVLKLTQELGGEKFEALVQVMLNRGAGPWVLLTPERAEIIKDKVKNISVEELKDLVKNPAKEAPEDLRGFLADISKYNVAENKNIKKSVDGKTKKDVEEAEKKAKISISVPQSVRSGGMANHGSVKFTVLEGKRSPGEHLTYAPAYIGCRVHGSDWLKVRNGINPGIIALDIYVDHVLSQTLQNVKVGYVHLYTEAIPMVSVSLENGIELKVGDQHLIVNYFVIPR